MRQLLIADGVKADCEGSEADLVCRGVDAAAAWRAFREVAVEAATDPIVEWSAEQTVHNAGFLFEAMHSDGWPAEHGREGTQEHFSLGFLRQFGVGEHGDMKGLFLDIVVPPRPELKELKAEFFSDTGDLSDEAAIAAAQDWIARVEADEAFIQGMTRPALRFSFGVDGIG